MNWQWLRDRLTSRVDDRRWVVVDVEASGLDAGADRLLAIAGVAIRFDQGPPELVLADSFEVILRQDDQPLGEAVDRDNILLHGIGVSSQRNGVPPPEALSAFRTWAGSAPVLGYHVDFDRTLIQRDCSLHLGRRLANPWADVEHVVQVLVPGLPDRSLDSAMARFGIVCPERHQAAADSLATAEVLLRILPLVKAETGGRLDFRTFRRLADRHRWLPQDRP